MVLVLKGALRRRQQQRLQRISPEPARYKATSVYAEAKKATSNPFPPGLTMENLEGLFNVMKDRAMDNVPVPMTKKMRKPTMNLT